MGTGIEAPEVRTALAQLCRAAGIDGEGSVASTGHDPVLRSPYRIGAAGAATHLAVGLAADRLTRLRGLAPQTVSVGVPAAVASLRANQYLTIDGGKPKRHADDMSGFYPVKDGRFIYLHCNFSNLRARNAAVLGCAPHRAAALPACATWDGEALETAIHEGGGCASFVRSDAEWQAHPHRDFVARMPVLEITRIGDAPTEPLPAGDRPLEGIRALELTRVIAGPACGRNLAEHGATVMKVSRPDLPNSGLLDIDSGVGKFSTFIDFRDPAQAEQFRALIRGADVFLQSYRPGALASHGYGPEALAALRPGLVYATLSAWGHEGPWRNRRGYDTIVQGATGLAMRSGPPGAPAVMPVSALDYCAGNLLTLGIMTALARRATEGGSWRVRVALVTTQHWLTGLGLIDAADASTSIPAEATAPFMQTVDTSEGLVRYLGPVLSMRATPLRADRPPVPLGTHAPAWPTN